MAKVMFLVCGLCLAFIGRGWMPGGNLLINPAKPNVLVAIAECELNVREQTGNNDGHRVEEYLSTVGLKKGQPWCAAFISWVFKQAGYALPRTGWSPSLLPKDKRVTSAAAGNVFGIYIPAHQRIAHCGLVIGTQGDWVKTIEGNTNASGGREGDGVYRRVRHKRSIAAFADWTKSTAAQKGGVK